MLDLGRKWEQGFRGTCWKGNRS